MKNPSPSTPRCAPRARPGHLAKRDHEYRRCGTANLFAVVEPKDGRPFTCATPDRSAGQFARVVQRAAAAYPRARTIHLVEDNLNTHCEKSLTVQFGRFLGRRLWRRLTVHFTPKHGSWLNQAEIALSLVVRGCLGRRLADLTQLCRERARGRMSGPCHVAQSYQLRSRSRTTSFVSSRSLARSSTPRTCRCSSLAASNILR